MENKAFQFVSTDEKKDASGNPLDLPKDYSNEILKQAKDFYHKIKSIYDRADYSGSYQLGQAWDRGSNNMREMTRIIDSDVSAVESIRLVDNTDMYSLNPSDTRKEKVVDWYIAYLMRYGCDISNLNVAIQESPVTNPDICVSRAGRLLTPDFLRSVIFALEIQKYCKIPDSKFRIVELGGGCGHLARALKLFIPNSMYVAIDIPETLFSSYIFLRLNFPHAKACLVTDASQLKDGIQEFDFVFVPTIFADCILQYDFDIFCNTASLGEMNNAVIRYWMDFVQNRLKVKYFFGLNRFLNTIPLYNQYGSRRLNENECSVLFDANWRILHWEVEQPFARCPYETTVARNLEIIATRSPDGFTDERDNQLLSQQIIQELMDEDWVRQPGRDVYGGMGSNVLANDLTMSGTLFKLWESIRLYPNKTSVAMMIIYLHTLKKTHFPFEELFYYRNVLRNLISNSASKDAALSPEIMLLGEKYRPLWEYALALPITYYPTSVGEWCYYIVSFFPSFMRPALTKLYSTLFSWLDSLLRLMKIR